jgi:hypothetical protein
MSLRLHLSIFICKAVSVTKGTVLSTIYRFHCHWLSFSGDLPLINEDGIPPVDSIMAMQDFWNSKYFNFVEKKVTREQLFLAWQKKLRRDLITRNRSSPDLNKCGQESSALEIVR